MVHDDYITSYAMDFKKSLLVINTYNEEQSKRRKIIFDGVLTYSFEGILQYNQILDIREMTVEMFFRDNEIQIGKFKEYCWPIDYKDIQELNVFLKEEQFKYIIIYSSFGLNGWVLAKNIMIQDI